jgi:hypothetical protein
MSTMANLTVYLQALGGKFLGINAYQASKAVITLSIGNNTFTIPYTVPPGNPTNPDDGIISNEFTIGASSFMPILTIPNNNQKQTLVNYLTVNNNTACGKLAFSLPETITAATLNVWLPSPTVPAGLRFTQTVLLNPKQTNYKVTVVIPGLLVQAAIPSPVIGKLAVFVQMMCGCRVMQTNGVFIWPPNDFEVTALIKYANQSTGITAKMTWDATTNNSLFVHDLPFPNLLQSVLFSARQLSTGNIGVAYFQNSY